MSLSRNVTGDRSARPRAGVVIAISSTGWAIAVDAATFGVSAAFLLGDAARRSRSRRASGS